MDNYRHTFETWNKLAEAYRDKFMDLDIYDESYDLFCKLLVKEQPKIFEIGCGPGNITKYLLSKRPDFKITAIDVAPAMVGLAKENNPAADFKIMDCRKIDELTEKFDGVMCGFCMPYLSKEDCRKLIKDCAGLLNNPGVLYFSFIEDDYSRSGYETSSDGQHTMFVYSHSEDYLMQALIENGFELLEAKRIIYPKGEGTATHMIMIARKI